MDSVAPQDPLALPFAVECPAEQRVPLVFASPHSGSTYPSDFLAVAALSPEALRRSEDTFVDELFAAGPQIGAPLLKALFPRAYLDPNREPYELDPAMFDGPLPPFVNTQSPRVSAGLGTIARVVASGAEIYRDKLSFAEAERRIEKLYRPYHAALKSLIDGTMQRFGCCLLVDCHSMPTLSGPGDRDGGPARVDIVLGDGFGTTCATMVTQTAERTLSGLGYNVVRNTPYAGGFTTRHYAAPRSGRHALQIEINRRLYMNESTHLKRPTFERLQSDLESVITALAELANRELRP